VRERKNIVGATQSSFIVVPKGYFFGIPTLLLNKIEFEKTKTKTIELSINLYEKNNIIGKIIFPRRKIFPQRYTGLDACKGYPPLSCPEGSKYYYPSQGKPFCCSEEPIEGFCLECPPGEKLALGVDNRKICCNKNLICNGICYSECPSGTVFKCYPKQGAFCEKTQ